MKNSTALLFIYILVHLDTSSPKSKIFIDRLESSYSNLSLPPMPSRLVVTRFVQMLRQELIEEFRAYGPRFTPIFDEPQTSWPSSYSKRYVTLTGALRDSLQVSATESSVSFKWPVPYANRIRYGWVTPSGQAKRGRDWVGLALKKHPVKGAVRRATIKTVRQFPSLRLIG